MCSFCKIDLYAKLKFVRYGEVKNEIYRDVNFYTAQENSMFISPVTRTRIFNQEEYRRLLERAGIVFTPIHYLRHLTKYEDYF